MNWTPAAAPQGLPRPLGLTIGSRVEVNPDVWRRHGDETWFGRDHGTLPIVGQGIVQLDDNSGWLHRLYGEDDVMVQILSRSWDGSDADDITIYQTWISHQPAHDGERGQFLALMRQPWWEQQGTRWRRFWFEGNDLEQPPVAMTETVHEDLSGRAARTVPQTCMLYSRPLTGGPEMLLAIETAPSDGPLYQEVMVGLPLVRGDFYA